MVELFRQAGCIIWMDGGLDGSRQSTHARLFAIGQIEAEKVFRALVEKGRLAVGRMPRDLDRNHVHELRELPFPIAQRRHGFLVNVDVKRNAKPSRDTTLAVARWSCGGSSPDIDAGRAPKAKLDIEMIAGLQAVTPYGGDLVIVVRMKQPLPGGMTLFQRSI
jgi:hypothetical protein